MESKTPLKNTKKVSDLKSQKQNNISSVSKSKRFNKLCNLEIEDRLLTMKNLGYTY
jgi:hypothetical protein